MTWEKKKRKEKEEDLLGNCEPRYVRPCPRLSFDGVWVKRPEGGLEKGGTGVFLRQCNHGRAGVGASGSAPGVCDAFGRLPSVDPRSSREWNSRNVQYENSIMYPRVGEDTCRFGPSRSLDSSGPTLAHLNLGN